MNYAHFINGEFEGYVNRVPASAKFTGKAYIVHAEYKLHQFVEVPTKKISTLRLKR